MEPILHSLVAPRLQDAPPRMWGCSSWMGEGRRFAEFPHKIRLKSLALYQDAATEMILEITPQTIDPSQYRDDVIINLPMKTRGMNRKQERRDIEGIWHEHCRDVAQQQTEQEDTEGATRGEARLRPKCIPNVGRENPGWLKPGAHRSSPPTICAATLLYSSTPCYCQVVQG